MTRSAVMVLSLLWVGSLVGRATAQQVCPAPTSTFDLVQRGIFEAHGCTLPACHGEAKSDGLDLRAAAAYDSLLHHVESADEDTDTGESAQERVVVPGDPDNSVLWRALAAKTMGRTDLGATPMPMGNSPLSQRELQGIRQWILAGAPQTGFVPGVSALITACPQSAVPDDSGAPACVEGDPDLLLPNLIPDPPADVRVRYKGTHRSLEFTTAVGNDGAGPLIIQSATRATQPGQMVSALQIILKRDGSKCTHQAGFMRFGDDGSHWGYGNMVTFELRKDDPATGDLLSKTSKTSFCLLDTDPLQASANLPMQVGAHCLGDFGRMGISTGYKDTYSRIYPGQWIDLDSDPETAIPAGSYYLINAVNPTGLIWESDTSDNVSTRMVSVTLADQTLPGSGPTPGPTSAPTPVPTQPSRGPHTPRTPRVPGAGRPGHPTPPPRPQRPLHPGRAPQPTDTPTTDGTPVPPRTVKTPKAPHQPHQPGQ